MVLKGRAGRALYVPMSRRAPLVDRRLYLWGAFVFVLLVFAGFARTYYLKGVFDTPELPRLVHVHGIVMTLWVALFVAQVRLVSSRRVDLHRKLGVVGGVLAAAVVVVGAITAVVAARKGVSPPEVPPLAFLAIPLGDLVVFSVLVGTALAYRRRPDAHRRLMLLSCLALLPPAVARLPFVLALGPLAFFGIPDLLMLGCIVYDTRRFRRFHPAFLWGALWIVAMQPLRLVVSGTSAWLRFASWLTG
jgi:hypothetical protein